jgi:hypothetical protein
MTLVAAPYGTGTYQYATWLAMMVDPLSSLLSLRYVARARALGALTVGESNGHLIEAPCSPSTGEFQRFPHPRRLK